MNIRAVDLFSSLANESRLRMLVLLVGADELCVCDLSESLQLAQPQVSRQLGLLREVGLVVDRRAGQWVYYRINPALPAWGQEILRQAHEGVVRSMPFLQDSRRLAMRKQADHCT